MNIWLFKSALISTILISLLLCSESGNAAVIRQGEVIDTVRCLQNPEQSYALYLPQKYDSTLQWPVIVVLDPQARGAYAAGLFAQGAEQLGYIIVASNNSRNGSMELVRSASEAMINDIHERFSIHPDRLYVGGMSGGARAALWLAMLNPQIDGVVACVGGRANTDPQVPNKKMEFVYAGITATKDFNFSDHQHLKQELTILGMKNQLLTFDGYHGWCPPKYLTTSMQWLDVMAYRKNPSSVMNMDWQSSYNMALASIDSLKNNDWLVEAYELGKSVQQDYSGLVDLRSLDLIISALESNKQLVKQNKEVEKQLVTEDRLTTMYHHAMSGIALPVIDSTSKGVEWWKIEMKNIQLKMLDKNLRQTNMYKRINAILSYTISLEVHQNQSNTPDIALKYALVWMAASPENPWCYWHSARLSVLTGSEREAKNYWMQVLKIDPDFPQQYLSDSVFDKMREKYGL